MISSENETIDLQSYEVEEKIKKGNNCTFSLIIHNQTGKKYLAKSSKKYLENLLRTDIISFSRELNILSKINHPSFLKFVGYSLTNFKSKPKAVIVMEYPQKLGLYEILLDQTSSQNKISLDITQKLIIIYGIATGMSYLHSLNVLNPNLSTKSVYLDDHFYPKLMIQLNSKEMSKSEEHFIELNPKIFSRHRSPEFFINAESSKAGDVYSFATIVYEIMTNEEAFKDFYFNDFVEKVGIKGIRPDINEDVPFCYRNLIEKCWSQNPKERPTFEEIVFKLRNDKRFINLDGFDKEKYQSYIKFIDESQKSFETDMKFEKINELIKKESHLFDKNKYREKRLEYSNTELCLNLENYEISNCIWNVIDKTTKTSFNAKYLNNISYMTRSEIANLAHEINLVTQLDHPSIIKFAGFSRINFQNKPNGVILANTDWNGLNHQMVSISIPHNNILLTLYGIASGMSYLHSHNIIHRDLKPENINFGTLGIPIITGFDIAKEIKEDKIEPNKKIKGTPVYIAPEVYLHEGYSKASDVYSFSLLMYEILTGERPYREFTSPQEIKTFICDEKRRPSLNKQIPNKYRELIERCWSDNRENRPTFATIVEELKTDPSYITDDMDKVEFQKYIKIIDNSFTSFEYSKKIENLEEFINFRISRYIDCDIKINRRNIFATETNNISFHSKTINISYFEKQKLLQKEKFKFHEVRDKKTGQLYMSKQINMDPYFYVSDTVNELFSEIELISEINHRAILNFFGYSFVDFKNRELPVIVTEKAVNGSLSRIF